MFTKYFRKAKFFRFFFFLFFQDVRFVLYSIGLLISVIFLTATLVTGFLLPSNHHVLHWRCQTYYVACLLVGDLLLAITQIFGNTIVGFTCVSMGKCFFFLHKYYVMSLAITQQFLRWFTLLNIIVAMQILSFHLTNSNRLLKFLSLLLCTARTTDTVSLFNKKMTLKVEETF